jgi:hypothetical protein
MLEATLCVNQQIHSAIGRPFQQYRETAGENMTSGLDSSATLDEPLCNGAERVTFVTTKVTNVGRVPTVVLVSTAL